MRLSVVFLILFIASQAAAYCPFSETLLSTLREESVVSLYKHCADDMNDDMAQARLAAIYDKGTSFIPQNIERALYYYRLSAENGNAESQARLAQLFIELDKSKDGRATLYGYLNSFISTGNRIKNFLNKNERILDNDFKGELIHPYVLLMLSNEKPENKWYYPTNVKKAPAYAVTLFKGYNVDAEKKKQLMRQASAWKKRKLLGMAREILSSAEYEAFYNTLYPSKGQADEFKRNQVLKEFQAKINEKKRQEQDSAQTLY